MKRRKMKVGIGTRDTHLPTLGCWQTRLKLQEKSKTRNGTLFSVSAIATFKTLCFDIFGTHSGHIRDGSGFIFFVMAALPSNSCHHDVGLSWLSINSSIRFISTIWFLPTGFWLGRPIKSKGRCTQVQRYKRYYWLGRPMKTKVHNCKGHWLQLIMLHM